MKSYSEITEDIQLILDDLKLTGDSAELNKRLAAYIYYHMQVDIVNALREASLTTATLMNSKILHCMDTMYSVYRGNCPRLTMHIVYESTCNKDKFDILYNSNTFKLYAANTISIVPVPGDTSIVSTEAIVASSAKYVYTPSEHSELQSSAGWPYYIDITTATTNLATDVSEDIFMYSLELDSSGEEYKKEISWTRIFTTHAINDDIYLVLTIPDYGIRIFKKNYFSAEDIENFYVEIIYYTTLDDINTYDLTKVTSDYGYLDSAKGVSEDESSSDEEIEQIINLDDNNIIIESGIDEDYYTMILTKEVERDDIASLSYQAHFASYSSNSMISNNDILFLFSEYFKEYILDCNFIVSSSGGVSIYYVPRSNSILTTSQLSTFLSTYDKYSLVDSALSISSGSAVSYTVVVNYVSSGLESISDEVDELLESYSYKLGQELRLKELESSISKLTGVSYVNKCYLQEDSSLSVIELSNNQYFVLSASLIEDTE